MQQPQKIDQPDSVERVRRVPSPGDCSHSLAVLDDNVVLLCAANGQARSTVAGTLAAAGRLAHDHVVLPGDYWTEGDTLVVMYPPAQATLAELLREADLSDGAAVTVLVPVLEVLEELHSAGVAGVDLEIESIHVDESGAPLISLHGALLRTDSPTPHWRRTDTCVARDAQALKALLSNLLSAIDAVPTDVESCIADRRWRQAADALLDWRQPLALSAIVENEVEPRQGEARVTRRELRHAGRGGIFKGWRLGIERLAIGARRIAAGILPSLRSVRRGVWITGALGASAAVAAGAVVLWSPGTSEDARTGDGHPSEPELLVGTVEEEARQPEENEPEEEHGAEPSQEDDEADEDAIVAALEELLELREVCLDAGGTDCLDEVVMAGTLLYSDDAAGAPQWRAPATPEVRIDQHLGDAVIASVVSNEQPASVLAVNTEAGWRLREIWLG